MVNLFKNINEYEVEFVGYERNDENEESKFFIPSSSALSDVSFALANINNQTNQF